MTFNPKEFILTSEGLLFAVVAAGIEENKVLCFLRYQRTPLGWKKLDTEAANALLSNEYPHYLFYSPNRDTECHGVEPSRIIDHFKPKLRLQQLLTDNPGDPVLQECVSLIRLLQQNGIDSNAVGVTGSLLVNAHHAASDIDLVFYDRSIFHQARQVVSELIQTDQLQTLSEKDWITTFHRRDCHLSFEQYLWHEQRKCNKVIYNQRKVDLSLLSQAPIEVGSPYKKAGRVTRRVKVTDASLAFDYPAEFLTDSADIDRVVCYTATYVGQALVGEWIEVSGHLEIAQNGKQRLVVGASREAPGEYIKVVESHD